MAKKNCIGKRRKREERKKERKEKKKKEKRKEKKEKRRKRERKRKGKKGVGKAIRNQKETKNTGEYLLILYTLSPLTSPWNLSV